jgi:hypothetical protein|eukprot:COSAG06_NODE_1105_length_10691_cov_52.006514_7_plen_344_part_00
MGVRSWAFALQAFALLAAVANAQNSCLDYDGIDRTDCVTQGRPSVGEKKCEWCGSYWDGTKCSNSAWAGGCSSGWKHTGYVFDSTPSFFSDGHPVFDSTPNYANGIDLTWKLSCPSGENVQLSFSSFNTESNFDVVTLYDGEFTSSTQLGRFSGSSTPSTTTSTGRYMRVHFTTDDSATRSGWSASWSCATPTCSSGQYVSGGSCRSCEAGTYQGSSSHSSSSCITCASGTYSSSAGSSSCSTCSVGTYGRSDRTSCSSCPSGKTSPAGSDSSSDCYSTGGSPGGSDGGGSKGWIHVIILIYVAAVAGLIRARCRQLHAALPSTTTTYVPPEMAVAVADAEGK